MTIGSAHFVVAIAVAAATLSASRPAHAQSAEAETLFRDGKRLMKAGQIAEACEKFEASNRLEPTVGTELNLADCREQNGQLASAWAMFVKAAAAAKHSDTDGKREAEARRRAAALEPKLVYLTIAVPDDSRVDGLAITRNDQTVDPGLWGERVPIDPDDYKIAATAPGYEPWTATIKVSTKNRKITVPALDKSTAGAKPARPRRVVHQADERPDEQPQPSAMTGKRRAAVAFAVVGLAAIGVGVGFGSHSSSLESSADATCPTTSCTDAHAVDLNHSARTAALIADAGYVVGGAAVITAAVLWLTGAPHASTIAVAPAVSRDTVGLSLGGRF